MMDFIRQPSEPCRGHIIHTRPWREIADHYQKLPNSFAPMRELIEAIMASSVGAQLFGSTSMHTLVLSDHVDPRSHDGVLLVDYDPSNRAFTFEHRSFSGSDDRKICDESEALQTLRLFLGYKYGIQFERSANSP